MHTKEPWKLVDVIGSCVIHAGSREVLAYRSSPDAENQANARRIVACVNACAGIDTDNLERFPGWAKEVFDQGVGIRIQRDKLLSALKELLAYGEKYRGLGDVAGMETVLVRKAKAAIARAESEV